MTLKQRGEKERGSEKRWEREGRKGEGGEGQLHPRGRSTSEDNPLAVAIRAVTRSLQACPSPPSSQKETDTHAAHGEVY